MVWLRFLLASETLISKNKLLVVVPVYNCPFKIVSRTINSLISQDYSEMRIVVIDDFSKVPLFSELSKAFGNIPRLTLIRNEANIGFANTLNKALTLCEDEEYFFVLEHDCELVNKNYVSLAIKNFENPKIGAVSGENVIPPVSELPRIKRVFVNHLSEDIHDECTREVGFLLLKADAFRIDLLRKVGGFDSAHGWKFACEEHIISYKIRSEGYIILKDPKLLFRAYWGGQETLGQNLKKEAWYGRGLGCAFATSNSDLEIGESQQLKYKKINRIIQLQYVLLTIISLPLFLYSFSLAFSLACFSFLIYFCYLARGSLALSNLKDKILFIITGYLRAWVYIPNFILGILYGAMTRFHKERKNISPKAPERKSI